jgi:hypothetical protein
VAHLLHKECQVKNACSFTFTCLHDIMERCSDTRVQNKDVAEITEMLNLFAMTAVLAQMYNTTHSVPLL